MPKTNFVDGVTAVVADWLNKVFEHVHDGADADGSAPKVDIAAHTDWGEHGEYVLLEDTADDWIAELRNKNINPVKAELVLPSARVRGKLALGPNSATAPNPKSTTLDRAGVTGPSNTSDWQALRPDESRRALCVSALGLTRRSPDGAESNPSSVDVSESHALYLDNLVKASGVVLVDASGSSAALDAAAVNFGLDSAVWVSDGRVRVFFSDSLPADARVQLGVGSASADKTSDTHIYSVQLGEVTASQAELWIFETQLSTGSIQLATPTTGVAIDVQIHISAQ